MNTFRRSALLTIASMIVAYSQVEISLATELARIKSTVITLEEFNKKYTENLKFFQNRSPSRKAVLEDLVRRELVLQEARKQGLDRDPEVQERMNTVLYHAFLDRRLSKEFDAIQVSEEEARNEYQKNPELRTSHLFVALKPNATQEEERKALERLRKIQREHVLPGKLSFAEVAQRFSEGAAAAMGGDLDYQSREKLDPAYYETALKLATVGRVSDIVRTQFGFHIIKLTGIRTWADADRAAVKRFIFEKKRAQIFEKLMASLRAQGGVTINEQLLKD
jgi:parvulin-like peptidyl-prolyl isomerase